MLLFNGAAYAGIGTVDNTQVDQSGAAPKQITTADLKSLRWIEGAWRGTGDIDKPFFERYHFENDSTLVVESFPDETLSRTDEVTRFELKQGEFSNWGGAALGCHAAR